MLTNNKKLENIKGVYIRYMAKVVLENNYPSLEYGPSKVGIFFSEPCNVIVKRTNTSALHYYHILKPWNELEKYNK